MLWHKPGGKETTKVVTPKGSTGEEHAQTYNEPCFSSHTLCTFFRVFEQFVDFIQRTCRGEARSHPCSSTLTNARFHQFPRVLINHPRFDV